MGFFRDQVKQWRQASDEHQKLLEACPELRAAPNVGSAIMMICLVFGTAALSAYHAFSDTTPVSDGSQLPHAIGQAASAHPAPPAPSGPKPRG